MLCWLRSNTSSELVDSFDRITWLENPWRTGSSTGDLVRAHQAGSLMLLPDGKLVVGGSGAFALAIASPSETRSLAIYGGELFPASISADGYRTYLEFFQIDRNGDAKGIVAIDLSRQTINQPN